MTHRNARYEADHADTADDGTRLWTVTGPRTGWGDADMLEVGVCVNCAGEPGEHPQFLTTSEARAHFSLWAVLKSKCSGIDDSSTLVLVDSYKGDRRTPPVPSRFDSTLPHLC